MDSGTELLIDFGESSWDIEKPFLQKQVDVNKKETCHALNDSFIFNCSNSQSSNLGVCLLPQQKLQGSPMCGTLIDLSFSGVNATESSLPLEKSKQEIVEIEVLNNDNRKFAEQIINCEQKLPKEQSSNLPSYRVKKEKNSDLKTSTSSGSSKSEATSSWSPSAIYDDIDLLENEKFDFNVSISPSFRLGDDDVFNSQSNSNNNEACRCNCKKMNPKLSTPQKHTLFPQTFMSEISQEATKIFHSLSPNEKPINSTVGALQLSLSPSEFGKCSSPTETTPCQQIELLDQNVCSISNQISFQQPNSKSEIYVSPFNNYGDVKCNSCTLKIESENQKYTVVDENKLQHDYDKSFNKSGCNSMLEMQSMRETGICNTVNERESDVKIKQNKSDESVKIVTFTNSVAKIVKQDEAEIKSCVAVGDENKENLNHMHQAPNTENGTNPLQYHYRSSNFNNTSLANQSQSPLIRRETFTVKPSPNESKPLKEFNTKEARKSTSNATESSKIYKQFKNNSNSEIKIANEQHPASVGERCAFISSKRLCKSAFNSSKSPLPRKETFTLKSSPSVVDKIRQKCKALSLESSHSTPIRSVNRKPSSASEIEKFTSPRIVPKPRLGSQGNTGTTIKSTYGVNNRGIASPKVAVQSNTRPLKQPNNSRLLSSSLSSQGTSVLIRSSISSDSVTFQSPSQRQSNSLQLLSSQALSETGSNKKSFNVLHKVNEKMKPTGVRDTTSKSLQLKKAVPVKAVVPLSKMTKPSSAVKSSSNTSYGPATKTQGLNVSLPSEIKTVYTKSTSLSATPSKQRNSYLSTPKCTSTPTNIKILSQSAAQDTPASVNKSVNLKRLSFVPTPKRSSQKRYSEKF